MNKIHVEIKAERLRQDAEWGGSTHDDVHEPEKWCGFLRHQLRLADRAACSLATDEITGGEEQALIDGYRERLIKVAAVAIAAIESLERIMQKRTGSSDKEAEFANGRLGVRIGGGKNEAIPTENSSSIFAIPGLCRDNCDRRANIPASIYHFS